MSTVNKTNSSEIEGSQVAIILCDETGAEPVRSILALSTKGDLSTAFDEDSEDFTPGAERQTREYRTNQTFTVEVSSALAADLEAMTEIGLAVDGTDGIEFSTSTDDRRIGYGEEKYVEIAYLADELPSDLSTFDVVADTELLHRFGDCKLMNPEIDPSSTPPMASWEWAVEGEKYIDYDPAA
jgi:hypothetical protein